MIVTGASVQTRRQLGALALAAVGPIAAITGVTALAGHLKGAPPPPPRVERFTDYITTFVEQLPALEVAREVWHGEPGGVSPWFNSLLYVDGRLAIVSDHRLVILDTADYKAVVDVRLDDGDATQLYGAHSLAVGQDGTSLWVYSYRTGIFAKIAAAVPFRLEQRVQLPVQLGAPQWLGDRIVANGTWSDHLLERYRVQLSPAAHHGGVAQLDHAEKLGSMGAPLFPGLIESFSRQLNTTSLAVRPRRAELAVAFKWNDRLNIMNDGATTPTHSVAGPAVTKLDFAVDRAGQAPVFTLSGETTYSYIGAYATEDAIIAMYAGRERRKHPRTAHGASEAHVFSWDGALIGRWRLPEAVQSATIDLSGEALYGLRWTPRPSVIKFDGREIFAAIRQWHDERSAGRPSRMPDAVDR